MGTAQDSVGENRTLLTSGDATAISGPRGEGGMRGMSNKVRIYVSKDEAKRLKKTLGMA
jgi:hypothetical protein